MIHITHHHSTHTLHTTTFNPSGCSVRPEYAPNITISKRANALRLRIHAGAGVSGKADDVEAYDHCKEGLLQPPQARALVDGEYFLDEVEQAIEYGQPAAHSVTNLYWVMPRFVIERQLLLLLLLLLTWQG